MAASAQVLATGPLRPIIGAVENPGAGRARASGVGGGVRGGRPPAPPDGLRYAFIHTYKPVLDDAPYRSFDTMEEYRAWCARQLPGWLGYGPRFEYAQAEEIRDAFARHGVRYLFIGKSGAILLGYPDTTQDADLFLEKSETNGPPPSPPCASWAST